MSSTPAPDGGAPPPSAREPPTLASKIMTMAMWYMVISGIKSYYTADTSTVTPDQVANPIVPFGATPPTGVIAPSSTNNLLSSLGVPEEYYNPYPDIPTFSPHGPKHSIVWPFGSQLHFNVSLTDAETHDRSDNTPPLHAFTHTTVFGATSLSHGPAPFEGNVTIPVTPGMLNNGTVWAHVYVTRQGDDRVSYIKKRLTEWRVRRKGGNKRSLLGDDAPDESISADDDAALAVVDDTMMGMAARDMERDVYLSYVKPQLHLSLVEMDTPFPRNKIPPQMASQMDFVDLEGGQYFPIVYVNEFWLTSERHVAINGTTGSLEMDFRIDPLSMWKWQGMSQMEHQWKMQAAMGGNAGESDILKSMITDTNPILLVITAIVSVLHSVFDMLAFKNDIAFFKKKKSMVGLSIRTMIVNTFFQVIIFLYLMDNDTSFMILMSNGMGLAIEVWKVLRACKFSYDGGAISWGENEETEREAETKEYDEIATTHLLYITGPLMSGYAMYSLTQLKHKSWYSWILNSLVGFIYMFGFVMMTPQLFINYKLKSVAHMNWRTLTYKTLGTFVDDLFAFVIKMPVMHRLSCFRDDIIFFIFLYQKWIYRVDYTRVNEFGQCEEPTKDMLEEQKQQKQQKEEVAAIEEVGAIEETAEDGIRRRGARDK